MQMYVISSLPKSQQSIASGIFQTLVRLGLTIGMAITTAIFDSVSKAPDTGFHAGDPIKPYSAVFWFALAASAICLPMIPFLKVGTQGNRQEDAEPLASPDLEKQKVTETNLQHADEKNELDHRE
jgi:MFS family permease